MNKIVLTGIKPTGEPHLGNYLGAIKPALALSKEFQARYFIADYHALNGVKDPELLRSYTLSIAACWLACGLKADEVLFYRQSDIPEIFELSVLLNSFTAKGLLNRAHAYKAAVAKNEEENLPADHQINMGLYSYPVLMAADILLFDTNLVPVGRDQKQHIEMAVDIAQAVNHHYKTPVLTIPEPYITEENETIIGLDGRKMSKSYNNTIPLFVSSKQLKKLVNSIVTNSQPIEEPKDPDSCNVYTLYKLFATREQAEALAVRYRAGGMGWGHAKTELFNLLDAELSPLRNEYERLMQEPDYLYKVLKEGAEKARSLARQKMDAVRRVVGIN